MKKHFGIIVLAIVVIALVMLAIYGFNFRKLPLSDDSSDWDAFGSYFGAVTGLLAFAGVLWSINDSNKQNKETSERDTFFKLLDLHTNKFNSVEYKEKSGNVVLASEAFKKYTEEANDFFKHIILYQFILNKINKGETVDDVIDLFVNKYNQSESTIKSHVLHYDPYHNPNIEICIQSISENMDNHIITICNICIDSYVENIIIEKSLSRDELYEYAKLAADAIYHKYGHITGHYFRNFYYAMKVTSEFSSNDDYKKLLRAQISRYEIAMNLYNALSSRSSPEMIDLLNEYNLFKDQYIDDVYLLQILPQDVTLQGLLEKSKKHIESKGRIGR